MREMTVELTFTDEVLGTASPNPKVHDDYVSSKAPDAPSRVVELRRLIANEGLEEAIERQMTVFPRDEQGRPVVWDYQLRGFFKDACGMLRKVPGTKSSACKAYKKEIDGLIFIEQRMVPFELSGEMGVCQRPLRASTAQGERVALASSETVPAGSTLTFTVICYVDADMGLVEEWLDYGSRRGLCQWRNSGKGRFEWRKVA